MIEETGSKRMNGTGSKKADSKGRKRSRVIKLVEDATPKTSSKPEVDPDSIVFAMDIGTRTVVGVVGVQEEKLFRVIATEVCEHEHRAMLDGQVHDIDQVASAVLKVKQKLEARIGFELKSVAIAAAGRVLKTCQVRVDKSFDQIVEIDADITNSLEIEGIQRAQMILDEETASNEKTQFYCVGYSVINYYLNGYVITKLTGHKAKSIGADVLATFLPLIVVDSLYSVMNKIGLEVKSLTLEPIAAINVTIPADIRLLNLALVDVGAGTSDIAITRDGSVIAYSMVAIAGDEITERICQKYLVDFKTGEKIKTTLSTNKNVISFTDIMKNKHSISSTEVLNEIEETLQLLASAITQRILEYNNKAPNAVFLVGGGSRIPGLAGLIAEKMGLAEERVVVRGRSIIRDIKFDDKKLFGPESITPIGIAVTAQMNSGKDFLTVTVNGKKVKLFNTKKLTVADALILFGFDAENLIGRSGKSISFTINGEPRSVRGEHGNASEIYVNGKISSLDTPIAFGDDITVIPAQDGRDAVIRAYELVSSYNTGIVRLNGNPVDISTQILINGKTVEKETLIKDKDQVRISGIKTLRDILEAGGYNNASACEILVNGSQNFSLDYVLKDGDVIICSDWNDTKAKRSNLERASLGELSPQGELSLQESPQEEPSPSPTSTMPSEVQLTVNGETVILDGNRAQYIFVDIFNYINFDLSKPQGTIALKLNGQPAAFTDTIKHGDVIEIYWKK